MYYFAQKQRLQFPFQLVVNPVCIINNIFKVYVNLVKGLCVWMISQPMTAGTFTFLVGSSEPDGCNLENLSNFDFYYVVYCLFVCPSPLLVFRFPNSSFFSAF